mmetsp:Transcript_61025/g.89492  ORF Transcript_61025/g.89492 Transcript_61025/m.89492 type:complete len:260 (+) Transcript_61025:643-1422(+)
MMVCRAATSVARRARMSMPASARGKSSTAQLNARTHVATTESTLLLLLRISCRVDGASPADCTPFVEAFDCSSACNCNSAPNTCVCAKEALAIRDTSSSIPSSRRTPPSSSPRFLPALALPPSCSLSTAALGAGCGVKIIPETGGGDSSPPPECWCGCVGCEATCMLGWDRAVEELLWLVGCDGVMLVGCDGVMMIPETGSSPPPKIRWVGDTSAACVARLYPNVSSRTSDEHGDGSMLICICGFGRRFLASPPPCLGI